MSVWYALALLIYLQPSNVHISRVSVVLCICKICPTWVDVNDLCLINYYTCKKLHCNNQSFFHRFLKISVKYWLCPICADSSGKTSSFRVKYPNTSGHHNSPHWLSRGMDWCDPGWAWLPVLCWHGRWHQLVGNANHLPDQQWVQRRGTWHDWGGCNYYCISRFCHFWILITDAFAPLKLSGWKSVWPCTSDILLQSSWDLVAWTYWPCKVGFW